MVTERPWLDWSKQHRWVCTGQACCADCERVLVRCSRCGQTRKVTKWIAGKLITRVDPGLGAAWGCARVPWLFRLQCWIWDSPLPSWDADTQPPWLADKE